MKELLVLGCREVDYDLHEEHVAAALYQAGLLDTKLGRRFALEWGLGGSPDGLRQ